MIVSVVVKPSSKQGPYIQLGIDGSLLVCVQEPALEGKANKAVIDQLAKHYNVKKSAVKLIKGSNIKYKQFSIFTD